MSYWLVMATIRIKSLYCRLMFVTCYLLMLGASGGQMSVQVDSYEEDATLPAMKLSLNKKIGLLILEQY